MYIGGAVSQRAVIATYHTVESNETGQCLWHTTYFSGGLCKRRAVEKINAAFV